VLTAIIGGKKVLDTRYVVGIDLGTTNSAIAQFDTAQPEEDARIHVESIPQLVNPNEVEERTLLPSFLYIPGELDFAKGTLALPWDRRRAGAQARGREPRAARRLRKVMALLCRR
jgi:molecular chaperone DnaK (HSP70)